MRRRFGNYQDDISRQKPITQSLHMCYILEPTLSSEKLFLEQAFPQNNIVSTLINFPARFPPLLSKVLQNTKKYMQMSMTELRSNWLIGDYALRLDIFSAKTFSVNNFSSEGVGSQGLYER